MHGIEPGPLATADLAQRHQFCLGTVSVLPAMHQLSNGENVVMVQPRIMKVLLALVDARGLVVSREALARQCWPGRFVAEDSLNAAIAELRKAFRALGSNDVSVKTSPKTGYRLVAPGFELSIENVDEFQTRRGVGRFMLVGGLALLSAATGTALWKTSKSQTVGAGELIARGSQSLRQGLPGADAQGVAALQQAVIIEPDNAHAWGLLALAWRAASEYAEPALATEARRSAELAATRALAIDPHQSDALTALALFISPFGRWAAAELHLRNVLALDPANSFARGALGTLLMSTGQVSKCLQQLNWLVQRDPWSPNHQFRRVYTLWSDDRFAEMDQAADAAMQSWPRHPAVWFARFWTLAFTNRIPAALGMLADDVTRPAMPQVSHDVLNLSLRALGGGLEQQRQAAITANIGASTKNPSQAVTAIMILSKLSAPEQALEVARGFLLRRGRLLVEQRHTAGEPVVTDQQHRMAMMLWVPASKALRMHPGFASLCDGIGLFDYWRRTRSQPDFRGDYLRNL